MTTETFEGKYIVDNKAFDDTYVFLDIETYLYRGIEESGFGENRNMEYLVNMKNKVMMVLENNEYDWLGCIDVIIKSAEIIDKVSW